MPDNIGMIGIPVKIFDVATRICCDHYYRTSVWIQFSHSKLWNDWTVHILDTNLPGPCTTTTATWHCRREVHWNLHCHWLKNLATASDRWSKTGAWRLALVPLTVFRSNSKCIETSQCSCKWYTWLITRKVYIRHDNNTVVTCAAFLCDRLNTF